MRIPTANVIVGFNREVMDRLFTAGSTYKNLIKELTLSGTENVLLFDSQANPNFISFEHNLGMGKGMNMKLTLIDPKGEFEKRFLSDNVVKTIAGFSYNDDQNATDGVDPLENSINLDMKKSARLYDKQFYSDLALELERSKGSKELYVAYGAGENLDLWSGPHRTVLTGADLSLKGARKINLTLTPTANAIQMSQRRGAYNEEVNLDLAGLTMRFTGISKKIKFNNIPDQKPAYYPLEYYNFKKYDKKQIKEQSDHITSTLKKADFGVVASELENFDFHSIVIDTLRSYIQKATNNPNVIVLLPNINIICRTLIKTAALNTRAGVIATHVASKLLMGGMIANSQSLKFDPVWTSLGYKEQFVTNFLSELGLDMHIVFRDLIHSASQSGTKTIPYTSIAKKRNYEKTTNANQRFKERYDVTDFYATLEKASNKGIPNHAEAVKSVIDKILKHSKEDYQLEYAIFSETDTKVLDYWSNGSSQGNLDTLQNYPPFGGYSTFNTQKEAIIVGDQTLIRDYLYGKANLAALKDTASAYQEAATLSKESQEKHMQKAEAHKNDDPLSSWSAFGIGKLKAFGEIGSALADAATSGLTQAEENLAVSAQQDYENSLIASLKTIPLHPLDSILADEDYQTSIRNIVSPKIKGSGPFGDISDVPDDFAFDSKDIAPDLETFARDEGVSIFRYNTPNPNILDMKFKFGAIYLAQLKAGFQKVITNKTSFVAEGILPIGVGSLPIRTVGAALAYLRQKDIAAGLGEGEARKDILTELAGKISLDVQKELNVNNSTEAANAVALLLDKGSNDKYKGTIEIDQLLDGNPQAIMTDFMQGMYRKALQMTITTLPAFHLSNIWTINSPCLVFAQDAAIHQSNALERTLMNSFFSGLYRIVAFKHTINTSKSESSFSIVKNAITYKEKEEDNE